MERVSSGSSKLQRIVMLRHAQDIDRGVSAYPGSPPEREMVRKPLSSYCRY
jgi:hypothetical protein